MDTVYILDTSVIRGTGYKSLEKVKHFKLFASVYSFYEIAEHLSSCKGSFSSIRKMLGKFEFIKFLDNPYYTLSKDFFLCSDLGRGHAEERVEVQLLLEEILTSNTMEEFNKKELSFSDGVRRSCTNSVKRLVRVSDSSQSEFLKDSLTHIDRDSLKAYSINDEATLDGMIRHIRSESLKLLTDFELGDGDKKNEMFNRLALREGVLYKKILDSFKKYKEVKLDRNDFQDITILLSINLQEKVVFVSNDKSTRDSFEYVLSGLRSKSIPVAESKVMDLETFKNLIQDY